MMAYFNQVIQKIDKNNAEMERKNNEISKLEEEVASSFKDQSMKFLKVMSQQLIESLQQQKELLSGRNEKLEKLNDRQTKEIVAIKEKCEKDLINNYDNGKVQKTAEYEFLRQLNLTNLIEKQNMINQMNEIEEVKDKCLTDLKNTHDKIIYLETEVQKAVNSSELIESYKQKVNHLSNSFEKKNSEIKELKVKIEEEAAQVVEYKNQLKSQKEIILEKEAEVKKMHDQSNEIEKEMKGCIARDSSGVYKVFHPKFNTFEILCNSDIAGPGWTVIQQRIRGGVEFQQEWDAYRNGFGDFWEGDFFIGLDKIHRLTTGQPHELYIHMQRFNGTTYHARYDEFTISGEDDQYRITKLKGFSGSTEDLLSYSKNLRFTTKDRDNDEYYGGNCAYERSGGWWYGSCATW